MIEFVKMWWIACEKRKVKENIPKIEIEVSNSHFMFTCSITGSRAWWTSGFSSMTARIVSMVFNRPIAVIAFSSPASADSRT